MEIVSQELPLVVSVFQINFYALGKGAVNVNAATVTRLSD